MAGKKQDLTEIKIRGIPPATILVIDQMAKQQGYKSRNEFLRDYFETFTGLEEFKNHERRYTELINKCLMVIDTNTQAINNMNQIIKEIGEDDAKETNGFSAGSGYA